MFRLLSAALAVVVVFLNAETAMAEEYRDPAGRFKLTVPEGWSYTKPDNAEAVTIILVKAEAGKPTAGGVCIGLYLDISETRSKSQADVNNFVDGRITSEFWKVALNSSGDKTFEIKSTSDREKNGRKIYNAVYTSTTAENGKDEPMKGKMELQFVPGSMHSILCLTEVAAWDLASIDFDRIFDSYEPTGGALVASNQVRSQSMLTLFSDSNYGGASHVLSQDTANLAAAGWPIKAQSLAVDGAGVWQVCDGINYTGSCRTIAASLSAPEGHGFVVKSARETSDIDSLRSAAATGVRRGFAEYAVRRRLHSGNSVVR